MKLTKQCLKDFEKWYIDIYCKNNKFPLLFRLLGGMLTAFYLDTLSEQYGVYVNFFRQAGNTKAAEHIIYDFSENCTIGFTTEEAITEAINKANEIYNKK